MLIKIFFPLTFIYLLMIICFRNVGVLWRMDHLLKKFSCFLLLRKNDSTNSRHWKSLWIRNLFLLSTSENKTAKKPITEIDKTFPKLWSQFDKAF